MTTLNDSQLDVHAFSYFEKLIHQPSVIKSKASIVVVHNAQLFKLAVYFRVSLAERTRGKVIIMK